MSKKKKENLSSITTAQGNAYIFDKETRLIKSRMDKHGFIYNAQGKKIGHIDD